MSELRGDPNHHSQLLESSDVEQNEVHEETASTIFRNLLEQARQAGKEPEDRQALAHVLESFRQEQMSWSPSIFNDLTLDEQLSIATAFSRIPEAQGNVSQIMVGELTYGLSFSDSDTVDFLREHIAKLPIEEKIDSILYLSTIFADAASQGYADNAADGIRDTLDSFETEANLNPFLRYAIQQTQAEIEEENEIPSRGVVIRSGDKDIGRRSGAVTIKDRQEMAMLSRKIKPEGRVIKGYSLRVARDAIATVDHALFPQALAFTSENFEAAN